MIKQKCTRLERCEVNLQHKKYRGIWLAGVKFFERDEPREELLEYSTFYGVVHCLVVCLVHCVVRRNTVRSTLLFEVRIVQSGYWNVLKSLVVIWSRFYAVCGLARLHYDGRGRTRWLTAVICEWNWMESWLFMILERTRSKELVMFKYFAHILTFRYSDSLFSDLHDGSDAVFRLDRPGGQVASFQVLLIAT